MRAQPATPGPTTPGGVAEGPPGTPHRVRYGGVAGDTQRTWPLTQRETSRAHGWSSGSDRRAGAMATRARWAGTRLSAVAAASAVLVGCGVGMAHAEVEPDAGLRRPGQQGLAVQHRRCRRRAGRLPGRLHRAGRRGGAHRHRGHPGRRPGHRQRGQRTRPVLRQPGPGHRPRRRLRPRHPPGQHHRRPHRGRDPGQLRRPGALQRHRPGREPGQRQGRLGQRRRGRQPGHRRHRLGGRSTARTRASTSG